jgi:predicted permease
MTAIAQQLQVEHPGDNKGWGAKFQLLREQAVGGIRPALLLLMGAVGFVLLIACANVANLLLAVATSRTREVALRLALGAGRARIVRQLLTESVVLALVGAAFGLALAAVLIRALLSLAPPSLPRIQETGLDLDALAFTTLLALVTGILFGLAPAFQISRVDLNSSLKQGGQKGSGGGHLIRDVLVVCEVAFVLVLLIAAGLLIRSFNSVEAVNPGFTKTSVLAMDFAMPAKRYPKNDQRAQICTRILDRLRVLPGVTAAGGITQLPLSGHESVNSLAIEGRSQRPDEFAPVDDRIATPTYFEAIGIPLRRGRIFIESDKDPAVINETLARTYFPDQDPIGRRVSSNNSPLLAIVGVVADVRHSGLETPARAQLYRSYFQNGPNQFILFCERPRVRPHLPLPPGARLLPSSRIRLLPTFARWKRSWPRRSKAAASIPWRSRSSPVSRFC